MPPLRARTWPAQSNPGERCRKGSDPLPSQSWGRLRTGGKAPLRVQEDSTMRFAVLLFALLVAVGAPVRTAGAQAPIEGELVLITPVSKFIHDAALKAFADYAKEKWNVTLKTNAIPAGTPVAYGRIVEWKGKPEADIFWGGESAL